MNIVFIDHIKIENELFRYSQTRIVSNLVYKKAIDCIVRRRFHFICLDLCNTVYVSGVMAVFILEDALSVVLFVSSIKTDTRGILRQDELSSVVRKKNNGR